MSAQGGVTGKGQSRVRTKYYLLKSVKHGFEGAAAPQRLNHIAFVARELEYMRLLSGDSREGVVEICAKWEDKLKLEEGSCHVAPLPAMAEVHTLRRSPCWRRPG